MFTTETNTHLSGNAALHVRLYRSKGHEPIAVEIVAGDGFGEVHHTLWMNAAQLHNLALAVNMADKGASKVADGDAREYQPA